MENFVKITAVSDLHGHYPELPGGDLLIVAGDVTGNDTPGQHGEFHEWFANQEYVKQVYIAGNHDNRTYKLGFPKSEYLQDSGIEFEGFKIWGSPWTKEFEGMNPKCKAFTLKTEEELNEKWALIPDDIDILITHSPPYGILDGITNFYDGTLFHTGSTSLHARIKELKNLKAHVFGHIHEAFGMVGDHELPHVQFINASFVNGSYKPTNFPQTFTLSKT